jgi:PAS domain-containing protein
VNNTTVVSFPHHDVAFGAYVERQSAGCRTTQDLEAALRGWYPRATVVPRLALADPGNQTRVWYAYRDGTARTRDSGSWWTVAGVAKVEFGREGVFVAANPEAVALAGGSLVGQPLSAVRPVDQQGDPDWLWRTIENAGAVTSVGRMRRLDESEIEIEFHAEQTRPGRYTSAWRRVNVVSGPASTDLVDERASAPPPMLEPA